MAQELDRAISMIAEAKTYFILACAMGTSPRPPERALELASLERLTKAARAYVESIGGLDALPPNLAIELRVCEKGLERLGGPAAPPAKEKS
jgi:hypothetical protein